MRTCVIYNPASGRGRAKAQIDARRAHAGGDHVLRPTTRPGDAEDFAREAADAGFARVIAAGGDGTVHEVANGLLQSANREAIFAVWPFGSANDYAYTLGITGDANQVVEVQNVDVGEIVSANGKRRFFVNCLGIGFNAAVTVEARRIRWLRGMPLYGLAVVKSLAWHFKHPRMRVQFDEMVREIPTLALTLNLGKREGGFPITPAADLCDGLFDYMHAGPVSRSEILRHFPNLIRGTLPTNHPRMWVGQCNGLQVESETPLRIHLDGEFFCQPEDHFTSVSIGLLPARLRVERAVSPSR